MSALRFYMRWMVCLGTGVVLLAISPVSEVRARDRATLVVGARAEPASLNPVTAASSDTHDIINLMFIKLMEEQDDLLTFAPRLARSWSQSEDGLAVTFQLRDDVRWWDGQPVTAADVRFTWEVQTDTTVAWSGADIKQDIVDVEVRGAYEVVFLFGKRSQYQLMDINDGVILPRHILGGVARSEIGSHEFGNVPVGNGPYRFERWERGQYIELVANQDYYEGKSEVERVVFKFSSDIVVLTTQLMTGEIDLLEAVPADNIDGILKSQPVRKYQYPSRRFVMVPWNLARPLFKERDVRAALTMAIDRKAIIATLYGGYARECVGPMSPLLWAYDKSLQPFPHDPRRATLLLREHGWVDSNGDGYLDRDGKRFEFDIITSTSKQRVDTAVMIEADLRKVGVKVNIRSMEVSTYQSRLLSTDFDAAVLGWSSSTKPDLKMWHTAGFRPNGYNFSSYSNPEVDEWIDRAGATLNMEEAAGLYARAQRAIEDDQPATFIAIPDEVTLLHERFANVKPNAASFFSNVRYWRVEPGSD